MTDASNDGSAYTVRLLDAPSLSGSERAACELRFRMSLEFSLGGHEMVLPSLQAWQLALNLTNGLPLESASEAEREVVALWETAEADALIAAFRPVAQDLGDARFEISGS
jgi:hypothetical protein